MKHGVEFITPNEALLYNQDPKEVFYALDHLRELHILRKRNCAGTEMCIRDRYSDWEDFCSDWCDGCGYTRTEARKLYHGGIGEFVNLPNGNGIVRFVI